MPTARLVLTSTRFDPLPQVVRKPPGRTRLLYVPTAAAPYSDPFWVLKYRTALAQLGYEVADLDIQDRGRGELASALEGTDVLVVIGGSSDFLLDQMRRTGFGELIRDFVAGGGVYVGQCAGAAVVGPDVAGVRELGAHPHTTRLRSTRGLALVDIVPVAHYGHPAFGPVHESVMPQIREGPHPVVPITDDQAILVEGPRWRVVTLPRSDRSAQRAEGTTP
jgi:dipeptidase E